jgi:glycosyltransferase involved in cell wall biosynthesis
MNSDDVSVVVPCYNREYCLGTAIESALAQHTPPGEVIVVDDGSTDNTAAVAMEFGDKVRLFRLPNRGPGAARNYGIRQARGKWVAFLDSDDVWHRDKLTLQIQALNAFPDAELIFCDTQTYTNGKIAMPSRFETTNLYEFVVERRDANVSFHRSVFHHVLTQSGVITSAVMAKRGNDVLFPENMEPSEDWALWLQLSVKYRFVAVDRVLVDMHVHSDNISSDRAAAMRSDVCVLESMHSDPLLTDPEREAISTLLDSRRVAALYYSLVYGDSWEARRLLATIPTSGFTRSRWVLYWLASWMPGVLLRELARWRLNQP